MGCVLQGCEQTFPLPARYTAHTAPVWRILQGIARAVELAEDAIGETKAARRRRRRASRQRTGAHGNKTLPVGHAACVAVCVTVCPSCGGVLFRVAISLFGWASIQQPCLSTVLFFFFSSFSVKFPSLPSRFLAHRNVPQETGADPGGYFGHRTGDALLRSSLPLGSLPALGSREGEPEPEQPGRR